MDSKELESEIQLPQLARFRILELNLLHNPMSAAGKLESKVGEKFELVLEEKEQSSEPSKGGSNCRILARVSFNGKWYKDGTTDLVISLSSRYESIFAFNTEIDVALIQELLTKKFYRDSLISQAYLLAHAHVKEQLKLMGLNSNRRLGFDTGHYGKVSTENLPIQLSPKRVRAKTVKKTT